MLLETVIGAAGGGLLRLAPEILKFLDRKSERVHELALGAQQYKLMELQQHTQMQVAETQAESSQLVAALEALREGIKAQATSSGLKWVEAISQTVRPFVTYIVAGMWAAVKIATAVNLFESGLSLAGAVEMAWNTADAAMLAGILNFWFLGRVFDKK